ncbi:MAG: hypothetical protein AAGC57_10375 [Pseudomonadota bacterium]
MLERSLSMDWLRAKTADIESSLDVLAHKTIARQMQWDIDARAAKIEARLQAFLLTLNDPYPYELWPYRREDLPCLHSH